MKTKEQNKIFLTANLYIKRINAKNLSDLSTKVPFHIHKVVTREWNNSGRPSSITGLKKFCIEKLKEITDLTPSLGCVIVVNQAKAGRTVRFRKPSVVKSNEKSPSPKDFIRCWAFYDQDMKFLKAIPMCSKKAAIDECKKLAASGEFAVSKITAYIEYRKLENKSMFEITIPDENEKLYGKEGEYIAFGVMPFGYSEK